MELKDKIRTVFKALYDENARFLVMNKLGLCDSMSDEEYLKRQYKAIMGRELDLEHPKTFNEKIQWLKLHEHYSERTNLVDKYKVKEIVGGMIGESYVIPTLSVYDRAEDIDFNALPNQFVLKCTHDSGGVLVCKDKTKFNFKESVHFLKNHLKKNFYYVGREWPYKNIVPKIMAEKYIVDDITNTLDDFKFFCFNGKVDNVMVVRGRDKGKPKFYHFDKNWNLCRFNRLTRSLPVGYKEDKPKFIDDMIEIAEILSKDFRHVRIDLFYANNNIYFGEFTFYNQSGYETGFDQYSDTYLGNLICIPPDKE